MLIDRTDTPDCQLLAARIEALEALYRTDGFTRDPVDIADDLKYALTAGTEEWHRNVAFVEDTP